MGYSFQLAARDILYAPCHTQVAHTTAFVKPVTEREIAQLGDHEGSIWQPIAPWESIMLPTLQTFNIGSESIYYLNVDLNDQGRFNSMPYI